MIRDTFRRNNYSFQEVYENWIQIANTQKIGIPGEIAILVGKFQKHVQKMRHRKYECR